MGVEVVVGALVVIVVLGVLIALIRYLWPVALVALVLILAWVGFHNLGH